MTTTEASAVLDHFVNIIIKMAMVDQPLNIQGFGTFEVKNKAEKTLYNPNTGQMRTIPASKTLAFKQSPQLKEKLTVINKE